MMNVLLLSPHELTPALAARWSEMLEANTALDSPFFRPEFLQAMGEVRNDVELAVLGTAENPLGFFPYQRRRWNVGRPLGGPMSDFQGVVSRPGFTYDPGEVVRGCGLSAFDFDHLLVSQSSFAGNVRSQTISPYLDLAEGFDAYAKALNTSLFKKLGQKRRKCEREVAPVRFEFHTNPTDAAFDALLKWKSEQYAATKVTNVFAYPWTVALLRNLLARYDGTFGAMISTLYVGDRIAAVHLWLRSRDVLHAWFPAYDPEFGQFSTGLLLIEDAARAAEAQGIRRIDLGRGTTDFKTWFMSSSFDVAEGSVACNPLARTWRSTWHYARRRLKSSPLAGGVQMVGRWTRPLRSWFAFR